MSSPSARITIDPAAEAGQLADLFNDLSDAVDEFRLSNQNPPLTSQETSRLKDEAQMLEDRAHYFTAEAIGATLQSIQPNLSQIKLVTAEACDQLETLDKVSRVISIATSALNLATAIAAGNPSSIFAAATALGEILHFLPDETSG
jgi:hypothetical protein